MDIQFLVLVISSLFPLLLDKLLHNTQNAYIFG